jgi:hypothetical protein
MIWASVILSAAVVFAIAAGTVGAVSADLAARPQRVIYDVDAAVDYIADHLPDSVTAVASYDQVRQIVEWRIDQLERIGLASDRVDDRAPQELVVVGEDETLGVILAQADEADLGLSDGEIAAIFTADDEYRRLIGAVRT